MMLLFSKSLSSGVVFRCLLVSSPFNSGPVFIDSFFVVMDHVFLLLNMSGNFFFAFRFFCYWKSLQFSMEFLTLLVSSTFKVFSVPQWRKACLILSYTYLGNTETHRPCVMYFFQFRHCYCLCLVTPKASCAHRRGFWEVTGWWCDTSQWSSPQMNLSLKLIWEVKPGWRVGHWACGLEGCISLLPPLPCHEQFSSAILSYCGACCALKPL